MGQNSLELISLHEDPEKVRAIDKMVHDGVFGSRAEVYRTGAYLLLTLKEARRLAMLDKLDPALVGKKVRSIVESLDNDRLSDLDWFGLLKDSDSERC